MLPITAGDLGIFKRDLWKGVRKLEVRSEEDPPRLRRYGDGVTSPREELRIIRRLQKTLRLCRLPRVLDADDAYIEFEYIKGIRAFNLLVALRRIFQQEESARAIELAEGLLRILNIHLEEFQAALAGLPLSEPAREYPFLRKCACVMQLLASVLGEHVSGNAIEVSLKPLVDIVGAHSTVPFRDLNPKNVIVGMPCLFAGEFASEDERFQRLRSMLSSGALCLPAVERSIVHCDFSGCRYLCPPWDDLITLNMHESTAWVGGVAESYLAQVPDDVFRPVGILRFIRLGCRKLAYRLLHYRAYLRRYAYENEEYYLRHLYRWIKGAVTRGLLPGDPLVRLVERFISACSLRPERDYFEESLEGSEERYYSDIYPY